MIIFRHIYRFFYEFILALIWTYRPFLILTVEFELALAIWLLSGLFKKAAWLATLLCFSVFSAITLYKAISGAESCGCFGLAVKSWADLGFGTVGFVHIEC